MTERNADLFQQVMTDPLVTAWRAFSDRFMDPAYREDKTVHHIREAFAAGWDAGLAAAPAPAELDGLRLAALRNEYANLSLPLGSTREAAQHERGTALYYIDRILDAARAATRPAEYRCPVCGSDDRTEHNDEMHAQERAATRPAEDAGERPEHEHYWTDAPDDETAWHCAICGITEYPEGAE